MKKINIHTKTKTLLADTVTPVSLYLKLRDKYSHCLLLESSDYHGQENSFSYLCFQPIASLIMQEGKVEYQYPQGIIEQASLKGKDAFAQHLQHFLNKFEVESPKIKGLINGLFGYSTFDAVQYMEDLNPNATKEGLDIPLADYRVFKYIIAFNHFKNELYLLENYLENEAENKGLETVIQIIENKNVPVYPFQTEGEETSNYQDETFLEIIKKGIQHCLRGDVFQIVLSRRFSQNFSGDEFNVYRTLRSLNPSPYLFYFDYGSFRIFGSSPEAQIQIKDGKAGIFPIAGTFRRSGDDKADAELAEQLKLDPKENAEHVMLVDLARNDLSRHSDKVEVETFREVQYYSHVIHLVSKVSGTLQSGVSPVQLLADTFPAGTLSGAPKHKALQLIDQYEKTKRSFYGGAIGFIGFDGSVNKAIIIRSFLSKDNTLHYQAGAGVVAKSNPESEVQEVYNKLAALKQAVKNAELLNV
jgi:anthranilate synthase component 1